MKGGGKWRRLREELERRKPIIEKLLAGDRYEPYVKGRLSMLLDVEEMMRQIERNQEPEGLPVNITFRKVEP